MNSTAVTERALGFGCEGDALVGVLHEPAAPASDIGVVVVVGGPQYRAGSHRQFVLLARAIADAGFAVLRFDYRGMGDSEGLPRSFEDAGADIGIAIDTMQAQASSVRRVVLWGLCDGASAALLYLDETRDPRVQGLCLLNPWVRSQASLARTQVRHYYTRRLTQRAFWAKLLTGGVGSGAWRGLMDSLHAQRAARVDDGASFQQRMARAWAAFEGDILLVLSGDDLTAKEFADTARTDTAWARALHHPRLQQRDLPDADHTISDPDDRRSVERLTLAWLDSLTATSVGQFTASAVA